MIHTEQHDSVEGSAGKNGGIPVQHGVEGLFQLQRTTTKGCQLILVPVYFNIGGIFQKMYNVHILHMLALCKAMQLYIEMYCDEEKSSKSSKMKF